MGMNTDRIDWSQAGTRLRTTPRTAAMGGRNPDWNDRAKRWKRAEEYAGEELTADQVVDAVSCPSCHVGRFTRCRDARGEFMDAPHHERRDAAGAARIEAGEFRL